MTKPAGQHVFLRPGTDLKTSERVVATTKGRVRVNPLKNT